LLVESVIGKTLDEVRTLTRDDLLELLGLELGPVRIKCTAQ
jgi:nitrogen fixation NifU-like protein